jgi:hypothetical protein
LRQFPESRLSVLCNGAPQLVALRIDANERPRAEDSAVTVLATGAAPDDMNFAHRVLVAFPELRHLALPYSRVMYRDLLQAADRLESLEVHALTTAFHRVRHSVSQQRETEATRMTKLTHLVADLPKTGAGAVLVRMPAVRCGRIGFRSDNYGMTTISPGTFDYGDGPGRNGSRLIADIVEHTSRGLGSVADIDDGNSDADDERCVPPRKCADDSEAVPGTILPRNLHVTWSGDGAGKLHPDLASGMGRLLANFSDGRWASQSFDARLPATTRRVLEFELCANSRRNIR